VKNQYKFFKLLCLPVFLTVIILFSNGCSETEKKTELTKVSVRLPWLFNNEAAGLFISKEKGFFQDENLDVTIEAGGVGIDPTQLVGAGSNMIGIADGAAVLRARSRGIPIKAFAVEFQDSPLCYLALEKSGIKTVKDFSKRKIGTQLFQVYVLEVMLSQNQMSLEDVTVSPIQFDVRPLIDEQVDTFLSFETDEPIFLEMKGHKVNLIRARENGYHFYSNAIFATEETIRNNQDILKRFMRAVLKGWRYAFEHKEETIDTIITKYNKELDKEQQKKGLEIIETIMLGKVGIENLGSMDADYWQQGITILKKYNQIDNEFKPGDVFTNEILLGLKK